MISSAGPWQPEKQFFTIFRKLKTEFCSRNFQVFCSSIQNLTNTHKIVLHCLRRRDSSQQPPPKMKAVTSNLRQANYNYYPKCCKALCKNKIDTVSTKKMSEGVQLQHTSVSCHCCPTKYSQATLDHHTCSLSSSKLTFCDVDINQHNVNQHNVIH